MTRRWTKARVAEECASLRQAITTAHAHSDGTPGDIHAFMVGYLESGYASLVWQLAGGTAQADITDALKYVPTAEEIAAARTALEARREAYRQRVDATTGCAA